ncbi:hypothetical protein LBGG_00643 [Lactobacillus gasseri MV-22]|nr:hypothetical protein LBGG_00643 [Lactobacillus gasseri MV-22]
MFPSNSPFNMFLITNNLQCIKSFVNEKSVLFCYVSAYSTDFIDDKLFFCLILPL